MRIAFVSTLKGSPWGGSEELWTAACFRALEGGHRALVVRYEWDTLPPKMAELRDSGAVLSFRPRRPSKIARLFPHPRWLRDIEAFAPDVVCLSQGGAYECAGHSSVRPFLRWLKRSSVPLVNVIQFNTRDTSLGRVAAVRARWLYERASVNAFVAKENAELAEERLGIRIPRAIVVVNPVNLTDTSALAWPAGPAARFASVARLDARTKGQDVLLRVLGGSVWRAREWTLDLFGEGPDRGRFGSMVGELGLGDRVVFRGQTPDVRAIWADHHALLLPSRAEGTPLAMLEAMVLGRPCLVCDVGGCRDWVDDSADGFLAPKSTEEHVSAALERLWSTRTRWRQIGQNARARALGQLGPDPGAAFLKIVTELASAPRDVPTE